MPVDKGTEAELIIYLSYLEDDWVLLSREI